MSFHLTPTNGLTNQADLTLTIFQPLTKTSYVQPASSLDFDYDLSTGVLTMTGADLYGSDVLWGFGIGPIEAKNVHVTFSSVVTPAVVDPLTGAFSGLEVVLVVAADIYYLGNPVSSGGQLAQISTSGTVQIDPFGGVSLSGFTGIIPSTPYIVGPLTVYLNGTITLNFQGSIPTWVFADGFEGGDTSVWTTSVP